MQAPTRRSTCKGAAAFAPTPTSLRGGAWRSRGQMSEPPQHGSTRCHSIGLSNVPGPSCRGVPAPTHRPSLGTRWLSNECIFPHVRQGRVTLIIGKTRIHNARFTRLAFKNDSSLLFSLQTWMTGVNNSMNIDIALLVWSCRRNHPRCWSR